MEEEFDLSKPFQADPNMSRTQNLLRQRAYLKAKREAALEERKRQEAERRAEAERKNEEAKKRRLEMITSRMYDEREMEEANNALNSAREESINLREQGYTINPPRFNLNYRSKTARRQDEIDTKKQETADRVKMLADRQAEIDQENADFLANQKTQKEEREKEDNYDWTYIDGDENTANQRQRTETNTRMEEQDVERVIEKKFEPGSTGKTDKEVYEANPELKEKYPTLADFKKYAQAWRDAQTTTETITEKKLVPVTEENIITQNREDYEKTVNWTQNLPSSTFVMLSQRARDRGINLGPQELLDKLASFDTEAEAVQWAKDNDYGFMLGRGGGGTRSGSTTTRGKTDWK